MAQTKQEIQALLAAAGSGPRHRFGQNFMIDRNLVKLVAEAGRIQPGDRVVEVGPGTGTLTEELLGMGAEVVAVEIDRDLAGLLRRRFGAEERFRLVEGDALAGKHALNEAVLAAVREGLEQGRAVKLVANLPYNIASPLVIEMLLEGVGLLAFTVQKEVADRLGAAPGSEAYGVLSVMAQLLGDVELLRSLPPQAFWPAPGVESALVRLVRRDRLGARARPFGEFVRQLFSSRRKMLRKSIGQRVGDAAEEVLARAGVEGSLRVENVPVEGLVRLFDAAAAAGG